MTVQKKVGHSLDWLRREFIFVPGLGLLQVRNRLCQLYVCHIVTIIVSLQLTVVSQI